MDGMTLLKEARVAGLTVEVEDGDQLRIHGPRRAEAIARKLIEHKAAVLVILRNGNGADADTNQPKPEKDAFVSARDSTDRPKGEASVQPSDPLVEKLCAAAKRESDVRWEDCQEPYNSGKQADRSAPGPCSWCGNPIYWQSVHGAITCIDCHPPAEPELMEQKLLVVGVPGKYGWADLEAEKREVEQCRRESSNTQC